MHRELRYNACNEQSSNEPSLDFHFASYLRT